MNLGLANSRHLPPYCHAGSCSGSIQPLPPLTAGPSIPELDHAGVDGPARSTVEVGQAVYWTVPLVTNIARRPHVQLLSPPWRVRRLFQVSKFPGISSSPPGCCHSTTREQPRFKRQFRLLIRNDSVSNVMRVQGANLHLEILHRLAPANSAPAPALCPCNAWLLQSTTCQPWL